MSCISLNFPLSKSLPKSPKTVPENKATPSLSSSNSSKLYVDLKVHHFLNKIVMKV
jgi:3-methyladenine DNA glycosylase AlkC